MTNIFLFYRRKDYVKSREGQIPSIKGGDRITYTKLDWPIPEPAAVEKLLSAMKVSLITHSRLDLFSIKQGVQKSSPGHLGTFLTLLPVLKKVVHVGLKSRS